MEKITYAEVPAASAEKPAVQSFAQGLNFYKLFWIFFVGSFAGVFVETLYCLLTRHHFESRKGLIYGPFNLVYGFGALFITLGLYWLIRKSVLFIAAGGFVLGGFCEFICSWVQEMLFGTVSWEYSGSPMSIQGRINLKYCIFWAVLAVVWMKLLFPALSNLIEKIPNRIGKPLTWFLLVFMILNSLISGMAVARMSARYSEVPPRNRVEIFLDRHYPDEMLKKIYPNMMFVSDKD